MKISEIEINQKSVDIEATVKEVGSVREFSRFGRTGRVATAIISDDSGVVNLTLWDDQIDSVKAGDKISVKGAYVKEWQGEKQLNIGRTGSLEVI